MEIRYPSSSLNTTSQRILDEYLKYLLRTGKPLTLANIQIYCGFVGLDVYEELVQLNPELFLVKHERKTSKIGGAANNKKPAKSARKPGN